MMEHQSVVKLGFTSPILAATGKPHGQACDRNQALPGDSPDYLKKSTKPIKVRTCCLDSMHPRVFLFANQFQIEIKRRGACDAREYENCTDCTLGTP